jgi:hypothetical protein
LSYTRLVLGERSPLGRVAALLARCLPPTTSHGDLRCGWEMDARGRWGGGASAGRYYLVATGVLDRGGWRAGLKRLKVNESEVGVC